ncbi:hypothetical protein DFJ58DRAFT_840204 [Suillus subalutaceus]|uniref:uncharacterized protein n=1 Tax=Suillus subalutaceus TaxID=48586 RepID=UPI001B884E23|nr:uncharacterized protein DFJ58DRAFT_840204 [Suillus subalutaceus]KAG1859338.1 hypothetical protein DFJ58DRAFT_840204 [Suillus subalutaceus]
MSAARAEWNRLANNIPALEERSSDMDEHLAPSDSASVAHLHRPLVELVQKLVKNQNAPMSKPPLREVLYYDPKSKTERGTTHPEMVTRTIIGPPLDQIRSLHWQWQSLLSSPSLQFGHDLKDRQGSTENAVIPAIVWHIARFSLLEIILPSPLFGTHSMYRTRLQGTRVKGVVYLPDFRKLMQQFLDEWAVFLAIPGDRCAAKNRFTCIIIVHYDEHCLRGAPRVATPRQGGRAPPGRSKYHIQFHVMMDY